MTEVIYKQLFNSAPIPMVVTDASGKVTLINEQAARLLDDKASASDVAYLCDFILKTFLKDYLEIDECYSFDEFLKVYESQHTHLLKGKNGAQIYADIKLVKLTIESEELFMWTFDTIEISKRLSGHLKERVKEQRSLLEVIEILFESNDIRPALRQTLSAICRGWRFPENTAVRIKLANGEEAATGNFRDTPWKLKADIANRGSNFGTIEVVYINELPPGQGPTFLYEERQLIDMHGKLIGMFINHTQAVNMIRQGASLLEKITSQVPGNTYQFEITPDGKTNILFLSKGADAFEYPENVTDLDIDLIYEDDKERFLETLLACCDNESFLNLHYRIHFNGTVRWRWLRAVHEFTEDGKKIWYGATQDITPMVDYMTTIEQMLFDISHVIRRPIVNILGISKFIEDTELPKDELQATIDDLLKSAQQLDHSIRQLKSMYINQKRAFREDIAYDFSTLVDRREQFFDGI